MTQNSLRAVSTLRASPPKRLGAQYSASRIGSNHRVLIKPLISSKPKKDPNRSFLDFGGEGGIRTLDTRLTYTPLAGERLQPLGHFSVYVDQSLTTASVNNVGWWLQKWLQNSPNYEAHDRWISSRREDITPSSICDMT